MTDENLENAEKVIDASERFGDTLDLIEQVKQGNRHAYHSLYEKHVGQVFALCFRLTGERAMAEDAVQEVFIQVWNKIANFRGDSKFSTWLHSVASNVTISYMRKQKGWLGRFMQLEDQAEGQVAESATDLSELDQLIMRLPERARVVFVLHAIEGVRHEDIAKRMNMAVGSSKAQFHRAKGLIKEWMEQ